MGCLSIQSILNCDALIAENIDEDDYFDFHFSSSFPLFSSAWKLMSDVWRKKQFFYIHSFMVSDLSFSFLFYYLAPKFVLFVFLPILLFMRVSYFCFFCVSPTFHFHFLPPSFFSDASLPLFIFIFFTPQFCLLCVSTTFAFYYLCPIFALLVFFLFGLLCVTPTFLCFFPYFLLLFFAFCVSLPLLLSSLILPHPCGSLPGKFHLRGYYQRSRKMRKNVSSTLTNTTTLRLIGFQQQPQQNTKHDIQNTKVLQSAWGGKTPNPKKSHF